MTDEVTAEGLACAEARLLGHVVDAQLWVCKQLTSMVETAVVDEVGEGSMFAALTEDGTDAFLRQLELVDDGLPPKLRVEVEPLGKDHLTEVVIERIVFRRRLLDGGETVYLLHLFHQDAVLAADDALLSPIDKLGDDSQKKEKKNDSVVLQNLLSVHSASLSDLRFPNIRCACRSCVPRYPVR